MKTVTLSGLGAYGVQANPKMAFGVLPWMWCFRSLQMLEQPWSLASAPCEPSPPLQTSPPSTSPCAPAQSDVLGGRVGLCELSLGADSTAFLQGWVRQDSPACPGAQNGGVPPEGPGQRLLRARAAAGAVASGLLSRVRRSVSRADRLRGTGLCLPCP